MPCSGNSNDHCCYLKGDPCPYVEENTVSGRRWACGLMRQYGNWDTVVATDEYTSVVAPVWLSVNKPADYCKTYPDMNSGKVCATCGGN